MGYSIRERDQTNSMCLDQALQLRCSASLSNGYGVLKWATRRRGGGRQRYRSVCV